MRRFTLFAAMMPSKLIEAEAPILHEATGKPDKGSYVTFSRFGYAARWSDGSGMAGFSKDETIATAIKDATEYLKSKGWILGDIRYNGNEITQEIIDECTTIINPDSIAFKGYTEYLKLQMECTQQPWYTPTRKRFNDIVSICNIKELPDSARGNYYNLIRCNDNGEIIVYTDYYIDSDGDIMRRNGKALPQAREAYGLASDAPAIDVVNAAVADIIKKYNQYTDQQRMKENKTILLYTNICDLIGDIFSSSDFAVQKLATLHVYYYALDYVLDVFSKKNLININAITRIITDYKYFDWSTCTKEAIPGEPGLNHYKVKLNYDIYKTTKDLLIKEIPEFGNTNAVSKYNSKYDIWFLKKNEGQWFHIIYGLTTDGKYGLDYYYGSEDLETETFGSSNTFHNLASDEPGEG